MGNRWATPSAAWANFLHRSDPLYDGQDSESTFSVDSAQAHGDIYLDAGAWGTPGYRRWGLSWSGGAFYRDSFEGTVPTQLALSMPVEANAVYKVRLEADGQGSFKLVLDRLSPTTGQVSVSEAHGAWNGLAWRNTAQAKIGVLQVDEYHEIFNQNGIGQRAAMVDGSGSTNWKYDNRGRKVQESKTVNGVGTFVTQWGYNQADMVAWMKYPGGNSGQVGEQLTYAYYSQGALDSLLSSIGSSYYVPKTFYDAEGRIVERQYGAPNQAANPLLKTLNIYNPWNVQAGGRLSQATAGLLATPESLQKLQYTYDAAGNILTIQDYKAGNPQTQTFTYDSLNRLVTAAASGGTGNYGNYSQETTAYDPTTGNISSTTAMGSYTYTDGAHAHAVTKLNGVQKYWYDANGNMTTRVTDATYLLSYNAENQLTAISGGSVNTGYVYDGDGVRVKSTNLYQNLAAGASVTSTVTLTYPDVITNGDNYADSGAGSSREYAYTAAGGLQYVQVDLGAVYNLDKVSVWHYFNDGRTYHNTKTQVSADGRNWTTIFDSAVSGEYAETAGGKTSSFTTRSVRYIRDYANGSTANSGNHWVEMEAWGKADVTYIGNYFEWAGSVKTMASYYYAGTQRVALRRGSVLNYLLGDHLGSNSLSVDNVNGSRLIELRYKAWGEDRTAQNPGRMPTSYAYTGQRKDVAGLYFYNARWYDPCLNRFTQADTAIPGGVQGPDRYAGMLNNP